PLAPLVAAAEAELNKKPEPKIVPKVDDALTIDPQLVATGKMLFATVGCANCHNLTIDKTLITSTAKPHSLKDLKPEGGCLADTPKLGVPKYDLSPGQRKAIVAAIAKPRAPSTEPGQIIARTMLTFNCYACHTRDKIGGPTEE